MKSILILFLVFLFSCSSTNQLSNKWIGRTDEQVVSEFELPDSVSNFENNGKAYFYYIKPKIVTVYASSYTIGPYYENSHLVKNIIKKNIFYFDSLNKIVKIIWSDTLIQKK